MSKKVIKNYNKLIAFLLTILGIGTSATFSACDDDVVCEYGTPYADFKISGTVTNAQKENIPGVKVLLNDYDSTLTDSNGTYSFTTQTFPAETLFPIKFIDIDGDENGNLQPIDTTVVFEDPEFEGQSGSWYQGETSKVFNIEMKEED